MNEENNEVKATEEETPKKVKKKNYLMLFIANMIIISIMSYLIVGGRGIKAFSATKVTDYMKNKYHQEFVLDSYSHGSPSSICTVHAVSNPTQKIFVLIKDYPKVEYIDNYETIVITEEVKNRIDKLIKSKYASKVFYSIERQRANSGDVDKQLQYTLEEVHQGPEIAPRAFEKMWINIHMYGRQEEREAMIQEMHQILVDIKAEGMPVETWYYNLLIADATALRDVDGLDARYGDFVPYSFSYSGIDCYLSVLYDYLSFNKKYFKYLIWKFTSSKSLAEEQVQRSLENYTYFESLDRTLSPEDY